jgi:3-hydroxyacyl-[acyl-carrier-protein] dehydratase
LLLNDLYTIHSLTEEHNKIESVVQLNSHHAIFKGHFPGQPVLPGVCMMQMITEITGKLLKKPLHISGAPLIKFLRMIDPEKTPLILFEIEYQSLPGTTATNGKIFLGSEIFMKFQIHFNTKS